MKRRNLLVRFKENEGLPCFGDRGSQSQLRVTHFPAGLVLAAPSDMS